MFLQANSKFGAGSLFVTGFFAFLTNGYLLSYLSPVIPALKHMYNATYVVSGPLYFMRWKWFAVRLASEAT